MSKLEGRFNCTVTRVEKRDIVQVEEAVEKTPACVSHILHVPYWCKKLGLK